MALNQDSGDLLWSFDTGSPLVSSSGQDLAANLGPAAKANAIFPGADGSLYVYRHAGASERGLEVRANLMCTLDGAIRVQARAVALHANPMPDKAASWVQKLPMTVAEVVDIAPSMTPDGSLVVGSRTTTVYLLDPATGAVLRAFHEFGGGLAEIDNLFGM